MKPELKFFIGKGGVGKSTTSALTSVQLSRSSQDTLLVSMDPAHNQRDIFQQNFSEKPQRVADHLLVKEVNVDYWIEKYLKETENTIKQTYSYESAFNLQNYFNVMQFSPGLEEYALLLAFENIIRTFENKKFIIFDMAPTALTLRFFSLPFITLIWLEELLKLREKIYAKKEIISQIKIGRKVIQQDKVKAKLEMLIHEYEHLRDRFKSDTTKVSLVMNSDKLSFSEAFRIKKKLTDIGIHIDSVLINKSQSKKIPDEVINEFNNQTIALFPFSSKNILGYQAINEYLDENSEIYTELSKGGYYGHTS
ncbi:MAG: ArsA family ATPase [Deltaproteobacteria bacterium]|jgi:arsenite-transporting ATPase|nr:ArsA family ATPase [Deltaproteobacteria bacterium]